MAAPLPRRALLGACAALPFAGAAACSPPRASEGPGAERLFIANAGARTVGAIELAGVAARHAALGLRGVPRQVAAGPAGSVLVGQVVAGRGAGVIQFLPDGGVHAGWRERAIDIGSGGGAIDEILLAADGGRYGAAVLRWRRASGDQFSLAVVDGVSGRASPVDVQLKHSEAVCAVAVRGDSTGPTIYLGLEGHDLRSGASSGSYPGRVVAVSPDGATLASAALDGIPMELILAEVAWMGGPVLYCLEVRRPLSGDPTPESARLLMLDALTLTLHAVLTLEVAPTHLAVPPGGEAVFLLVGGTLLKLDIPGGGIRRAIRLPGRGLSVAASAERIYIAGAYGDEVWTIDRRSGRRLESIDTGAGPVGLALSRARSPLAAIRGEGRSGGDERE